MTSASTRFTSGPGALPALDEADLERTVEAVGDRWEGLRRRHLLLTGGTGFVGKWLLATLQHADRQRSLDCRVTVLTRNARRFAAEAPGLASAPRVDLLEGDVRSFEMAPGAVDHIVHAATDVATASAPLDAFDTCVGGTRRVLDIARRSGATTLIVSSGAVYGRQPAEMREVSEAYLGGPDPMSTAAAYAEGKRASEWLGAAYAETFGMSVKVARCFAFVGPYLPLDKHFAIGNFLADALEGRPIRILGDGSTVRGYQHGSDMAAWLWSVLLAGRSGTAYNVGSDEAVDMLQLAETIAELSGSDAGIELRGTDAKGPPNRYVPSVTKARTELGLAPSLGLREAIDRTLRWHRQHAN